MKNLPNLRQNRMKLKTLSLANQVVGWTLKRQGNSLSGTSKVGGRCLVLPSAMRSSKSKHFCRTILACWKRENKIINSWTRMKKHPATFCYVHMRKINDFFIQDQFLTSEFLKCFKCQTLIQVWLRHLQYSWCLKMIKKGAECWHFFFETSADIKITILWLLFVMRCFDEFCFDGFEVWILSQLIARVLVI